MSLLGFDALGRLALGQLPSSSQTTILTASAGSFALTGNAATFTITENAVSGSYAVTGFADSNPISEIAAGGSYVLTLAPVTVYTLTRTGDNTDQVYGGVGHYRLERERARQLAKITRKTPAPIDRTTAPTFKPIGRPPIAPPAPVANLSEVQNQRTAALASASAIRKRREIEAILLLAS